MAAFRIGLLVIAALAASCASGPLVDMNPYSSPVNFSFRIDDGTGVYDSSTKYYQVQWCGRDYPGFNMDLGQARFEEIERLVADGGVWEAKVERDPTCADITPARPNQFFWFEDSTREITLDLEQCQIVSDLAQKHLNLGRSIVRQESDKRKLRVNYQCIAF